MKNSALITGASGGIGYELAKIHASKGGDLILVARNLEKLNQLKNEIENSFHPYLARMIVKIFNDPTLNINNSQLIYTTHDLSLMSSEFLRKDQVYLSEKSVENGSVYFSLENFDSSLKDNSPFAKWYNEGKLGGIPRIDYAQISLEIKEGLKNA